MGPNSLVLLGLCLSVPGQALHLRNPNGAEGHIGKPSVYQSPRFRWWWPGGSIEPDEVVSEIKSIIDAGFGGGEIGDVQDSITEPDDPKIYGWAQDRWNKGVTAAYNTANKLGGYVDLTLGPHWPTGFPGYTPDSKETMKELVHGQVFVQAGKTYKGKLPVPVAAPSGNQTGNMVNASLKLVAVLTAKVNTTSATASIVGFDSDTVADITAATSGKSTIQWTAPKTGNHVLVAVYGRGTGQVQNMYDMNRSGLKLTYPYPAYIVDHFSTAGFEAGAQYWNKRILTPTFRKALAKNGGSIFEDSLELKYKQYWTLNFIKEFKSRRGYDLTPFLLYVLKDTNTYSGSSKITAQITNDFYQTVSDLYVNYRLKPLRKWANNLGLKLRVQPYTISADSAYAASQVDIPEGESLGFDGVPDSFRVLATGRDVAGKQTILSDELGAYFGKAYGVTWQFLLGTANHDMATGVSQVVIHGFPYQSSSTSVWPGYAPFTPLSGTSNGFADAWGPRQPQWRDAKKASSYLANAQKILQESASSVDVAILNENWGVTASWPDKSLNAAGFSYQFPTPELLRQYDIKVKNKRLAPDGPAYKALVVQSTAMDVSTAKLLLSYGKSGLPIVFVTPLPRVTFGYTANAETEQQALQKILSNIQKLKTTLLVDGQQHVPAAISKLGVTPSVRYPTSGNFTLTSLRRIKDSGYLYWVYNESEEGFSGILQLEKEAQPFKIDVFTGSVIPVASFQTTSGYTSVNVTLGPKEASAFYLGSTNAFGAASLKSHLVATDCDSYVRKGSIFIASNTTCTAKTSQGKLFQLSPPEPLPSTISSFDWKLSVQDWSPADANRTGADSYKTIKKTLPTVELNKLAAWPEIEGLESASGVGTYTTEVTLNKALANTRILLNVGDVEGSWSVKLNGKSITEANWLSTKPIDITDAVRNGKNKLEITVATTLWNKLRSTWSRVYGSEDAQAIGLIGPVLLSHVWEKQIS